MNTADDDKRAARPRLRGERQRRLIVAAVIVVSLGAIAWHKVLREEFFPKNFGVVEDGQIYRSGQLTERMLRKVVADYEIRTIVALNDADDTSVMERATAGELGVDRIAFNLIGDGTGAPEDYAAVVEIMANPEMQPVLVHCAAGAQRTSTSVILYRHLIQDVPIAEAYPESFGFKHDEDDWALLAYIADRVGDVRRALGAKAEDG